MAVLKPSKNETVLYCDGKVVAVYADGLYDTPEFVIINAVEYNVDAVIDNWTEKGITREINLTRLK